MRTTIQNIFVLLERDTDIGGWTAHALDIDVVTQGDSLAHAMDMVCEAVSMMYAEGRQTEAPVEFWNRLHHVCRDGTCSLGLVASVSESVQAFVGILSVRREDGSDEPVVAPLAVNWVLS